MDSIIEEALSARILDLRKRPYTRFIDQKCTPDLLSLTTALIVELYGIDDEFSNPELQREDEAKRALAIELNKASSSFTRRENNKVFMHSLKMLTYAGILNERKVGNTYYFSIENIRALRKLANDERRSLEFITGYITETFSQTDSMWIFEEFKSSSHDAEAYSILKKRFIQFARRHMGAGKKGSDSGLEARRILPKIMNPLAIRWNMNGSIKGRVSKSGISMMDLRYGRVNARDQKLQRSSETSRKERAEQRFQSLRDRREYRVSEAKRSVRQRHQDISEVSGESPATQVHHIFPQSEFSALASVPENLILLTPDEHNLRAHPNNKTNSIDKSYQRTLLLKKLDHVEESEAARDGFYKIEEFAHVVETGYGLNKDELKKNAIMVRREIESRG